MTVRPFLAAALATLAAALAAGITGAALADTLVLKNPTAFIPPQCYTKTEDAVSGLVSNPCQTCHVASRAPNYVDDPDQQLDYAFPGPALKNPWTNLFVDRRAQVAATDADEILAWVRADNYADAAGRNILAAKLDAVPEGWDANGDGRWSGYVPDVAFRFDPEGWDIGADGTPTGWRAFLYTPVPGSFWPTNGSADDVLIRLPAAYRERADGTPDRTVYTVNLALTEALIRRQDVAIEPVDETLMGADLDRDGRLGTADRIAFAFDPRNGVTMRYAGRAGVLQDRGEAPLAAGLFPLGTEFVHSLRYLDVVDGQVQPAARMKELRYMRKTRWQTYFDLQDGVLAEIKEAHDFPDRLPLFDGNDETGISSGTGWRLQGFIEDAGGDLRPQRFEETVFCMGCHGGVGVTDDSTFAFSRKLQGGTVRGWSHWAAEGGFRGVPDLVRHDGTGDYAHYLATNHAGDEFRGNAEVIRDWLDADGAPLPDRLAGLAADIGPLVTPSPQRALDLNAAYRLIVREQSFIHGRDATIAPQQNVWRELAEDQTTGTETPEPAWFGPARSN